MFNGLLEIWYLHWAWGSISWNNNLTGVLYSKSNKIFDITEIGLIMKYLSAGRFKNSYNTITRVCCRHAYDVSKYLLFKCWNLLQTKWKSKRFYDWKLGVFSNHIHLELRVNLVSNFRGYEQTFQSMKKNQVKISKFAPRTSFDLNDLKMTHCEFQNNYHGTTQFLPYMLRIAFGVFVHLF